jgi:hypothetical protein
MGYKHTRNSWAMVGRTPTSVKGDGKLTFDRLTDVYHPAPATTTISLLPARSGH